MASKTSGVAAVIPEMTTVDEVADRLRTSPLAVRRLIADGSIRAYKVGKSWRIPVEELRRYLDAVASVNA